MTQMPLTKATDDYECDEKQLTQYQVTFGRIHDYFGMIVNLKGMQRLSLV